MTSGALLHTHTCTHSKTPPRWGPRTGASSTRATCTTSPGRTRSATSPSAATAPPARPTRWRVIHSARFIRVPLLPTPTFRCGVCRCVNRWLHGCCCLARRVGGGGCTKRKRRERTYRSQQRFPFLFAPRCCVVLAKRAKMRAPHPRHNPCPPPHTHKHLLKKTTTLRRSSSCSLGPFSSARTSWE